MHTVYLLLYLIAAVCFLLATFNVAARINLVALGLLAWVLVYVVSTVRSTR